MKKPKTYEINTFADFLKIPADKLPMCLDQFKETLLTSKAIYDLVNLLGQKDIKDFVQLPMKWIDDGKQNINIKISAKTT